MSKCLKLFLITLFGLFLASSASAQGSFFSGNAYRYTPVGIFAASGATVQVCTAAGAGTPCTPTISLFKDSALSIPATNPLSACSGAPPQFGCVDGLGNFSFYASTTGPYVYTITGASLTAYGPIPIGAITSGSLTANNAFSGNNTFTSINNIQFCDNFVGSDASAKIQACINALPAAGGTVDARNLQDIGGTGSTIIDPGTVKAVTLLLGPYTYQIKQIVLRTGLRVWGAGMGQGIGATQQPTILQQCATCGAIDTFTYGGTNAIQNVELNGFRLLPVAGGGTAVGIHVVAPSGGGLWYSPNFLVSVCVGACGAGGVGFGGGNIIFDGNNGVGVNQWVGIRGTQSFRTAVGGSSLILQAANGQFNIDNSEFDGPSLNDGGTNVKLLSTAASSGPYSITFNNVSAQKGSVGISIAGAFSITWINTHFENTGGAFLINSGVGSFISGGIAIIGSTCQNACGNNTGAGFFAKTTSPNGVSVKFTGNQIQNSVDANYVGFTNIQNFTSIGDESDSATGTTPLANLFGQQITYKVGSGAGDYTTTSTNYVAVDGTNLLASIFIPTGWKLVVSASGAIQSDTAAAQVFTAIADGGTPTVVNTSLASAASLPVNFSLNTVIAGNGATHSVDLRFKTAAGADAAHILNTAGNGIPQMVFTLMPSN